MWCSFSPAGKHVLLSCFLPQIGQRAGSATDLQGLTGQKTICLSSVSSLCNNTMRNEDRCRYNPDTDADKGGRAGAVGDIY